MASFEVEAQNWEKRAHVLLSDMSPAMVQGRGAYAARQASIRRRMANYCRERWIPWQAQLKDGQGGIALEADVWTFV